MHNLFYYNLAENLKPSAKINKISSQFFLYRGKIPSGSDLNFLICRICKSWLESLELARLDLYLSSSALIAFAIYDLFLFALLKHSIHRLVPNKCLREPNVGGHSRKHYRSNHPKTPSNYTLTSATLRGDTCQVHQRTLFFPCPYFYVHPWMAWISSVFFSYDRKIPCRLNF